MKKKVIVIGSGISGLSISNMLSPGYDVKILEKAAKVGGLIKCVRINGNLFHLVGGHVFNSKNHEVLEWFWNKFDKEKEFLKAVRNAKILYDNKVIGYPIENFIYQLPEDIARNIIKDLLILVKDNVDTFRSKDFKSFLKQSFGPTLYNIYFGPYNSKIWNTDLSSVPLDWLEGKLPMPNVEEILNSNILKVEEGNMVHSTFYYPVRDGSQFIVNRFAENLDIKLSYEVCSINYINNSLVINNGEFVADKLVYCGDIRKLHELIAIEDESLNVAMRNVADLASNGTSNVLCETDENDISWLYLPESKYKAHRIIYTGNFSESNNEGTSRKTCVVEFSGHHAESEILKELKLLPGNLKALAFNYEANSYILHRPDTKVKVQTLKTLLEKYSIHLLGRFSEWEYYNMDKCIEGALELRNKFQEEL
jgi:protoporphyrinogen oxidase